MAGPTEEQKRYTQSLLGVNPDDHVASAKAPGGAPGGGAQPWSFNPLKPTTPSMKLDPNYVAASDEAKAWVKTYLSGNSFSRASVLTLGDDAAGDLPKIVMFAGKPTASATAIKTTVAAGALGRLSFGDLARRMITEDLVREIMTELLARPAPEERPKPDKKDDDGPEATIEVTPDGVQTNLQFTIKLRAQGDDDPRKVILLPDVEITLHLGPNADASTVEAQLNLVKVKQDVAKTLTFNGHVLVQSIEFKAGVSGEANMTDVALAKIQKSIEVKVKAELEFKVNKAFSFSVEGDAGQGGFVIGPKLIFHF